MSLIKQKHYRIIRSNKHHKQRYSKATRINSPRLSLLRTICLLIQSPQPKQPDLSYQILQQNLILFDQQTYLQASFDKILRTTDPQLVWLQISPHLKLERNCLVIYLEEQPGNLFINNDLLDTNKLQHPDYSTKKEQWGMVERMARVLAETVDRAKHEQLMMSVVGFNQNTMVDLLNLEKQGKQQNLKICREGAYISVTNLTEMEVMNVDFFVNSLLYCRNYKNLYERNSGVRLQAQVYQFSVCQLSQDQSSIQSIKSKCNLIKITKQSPLLKNSIRNCLSRIGKEDRFMPARNCKLTHFIEDCLNTQTSITVLSEVHSGESMKSQMDSMSFSECTPGGFLLRKNYCGDRMITKKIQELAHETQKIGRTLMIDQGLQKTQSHKLAPRSRKISPALLSQTISSTKKRISLQQPRLRTQSQQQPHPNLKLFPKLSGPQKTQIIRHLYKYT